MPSASAEMATTPGRGACGFSREVGKDREVELGYSNYQGRGQQLDTDPIAKRTLQGLDFTFRSYPGAYRRFILQAEGLQHHVAGGDSRRGWYVDAALLMNQSWEIGARADHTAYPFPIEGHEFRAQRLSHALPDGTDVAAIAAQTRPAAR